MSDLLHASASPSPRGSRLACTLDLLRPIHSILFFPSFHDIPFSRRSLSLYNSELLTASSSSDFLQGSRIHTNRCANLYFQLSLNGLEPPPSPSSSIHSRRHSRLHSRNLSVFFPRPGSLPHSTIAEDGSQEIEINLPTDGPSPAGVPMPSASPTLPKLPKKFGEGFTFGGRPPPIVASTEEQSPPLPRGSRRGHHHKHSLPHNFFLVPRTGRNGAQRPGITTHSSTRIPLGSCAAMSPVRKPFSCCISLRTTGIVLARITAVRL
jgi:hypothetical protein